MSEVQESILGQTIQRTKFDIKETAKKGIIVAIVGKAESGKTTLVRNLIAGLQKSAVDYQHSAYGKTFPFGTVICCLNDTWADDYENYKKELGLRHSLVSFAHGRYYYTRSAIRDALVVLEDIPSRIRTHKSEKAFEVMLKSIVSRRRRSTSGYVFIFVSQYLSLIPVDIIPEVDFFVFMQRGCSVSALREAFPSDVCNSVQKYLNVLSKHDYIVFNAERRILTAPTDTYNPELLLSALCGVSSGLGIVVEKGKRDVKIGTKKDQIIRYAREHPDADYEEITLRLGFKNIAYTGKVLWQARKENLLMDLGRDTKQTKLLKLLEKNPDAPLDELASAIDSTIDSVNVMKRNLIKQGLLSQEVLIEARRKKLLEKLKELGINEANASS